MSNKAENNLAWMTWFVGAAIGAFAMYFSDPDRGRRRRALVRDQVLHWSREVGCAFDVAARDLGNRLQGVRAQARQLVSRERQVPDVVLEQRARARLGRATSHPRAIKVLAQQGWINLSGAVLAREKEVVLETVKATPGVVDVTDNMQTHETPEHIPSLQGNHEIARESSVFAPDNWPPATRILIAFGGSALGCYGLIRRSPANVMLATLGLGLMATSALTNPRASRRRQEVSTRASYTQSAQATQGGMQTATHEHTAETAKPAETVTAQQASSPQVSPQLGSLLH